MVLARNNGALNNYSSAAICGHPSIRDHNYSSACIRAALQSVIIKSPGICRDYITC